ncbi:hypothetical protein ACQY0O_001586 [Thecaphora frezii]
MTNFFHSLLSLLAFRVTASNPARSLIWSMGDPGPDEFHLNYTQLYSYSHPSRPSHLATLCLDQGYKNVAKPWEIFDLVLNEEANIAIDRPRKGDAAFKIVRAKQCQEDGKAKDAKKVECIFKHRQESSTCYNATEAGFEKSQEVFKFLKKPSTSYSLAILVHLSPQEVSPVIMSLPRSGPIDFGPGKKDKP